MKPLKRQPNTTIDGKLACKFGEPWMGPHPICEKLVEGHEPLDFNQQVDEAERAAMKVVNRQGK